MFKKASSCRLLVLVTFTVTALVGLMIATGALAGEPGQRSLAAKSGAAASGVDSRIREAIQKLNDYRKLAGLRKLKYNPKFSKMAQAHTNFYNQKCQKGSNYLGHFEPKDDPDYSAEGDEASRTSGLGFNARSPLEALEILMSIPYHRSQFLEVGATEVGAGYSDQNANCRIGLFVTHQLVPKKWKERPPPENFIPGQDKFVVFPSHGAKDVPTIFNPLGEMPNPRPVPNDRQTGYPITIRILDAELEKSIVAVEVSLKDQKGLISAAWVSHPNAPALMDSVDAKNIYTSSDKKMGLSWLKRNHASVFILPQKPLEAFSVYQVEVKMTFADGHAEVLSWHFETSDDYVFRSY